MRFRSVMLRGFLSAAALAFSTPTQAQVTCGLAQQQLQQYVAQVNYVANLEYHQGIPQRCYGNQYCMNTLLQQLNMWYQNQAAQVNQWYYQISVECSGERPSRDGLPGRGARAGGNEIDESAIDDLEVDDQDADVAIVIPDSPNGFRPRR